MSEYSVFLSYLGHSNNYNLNSYSPKQDRTCYNVFSYNRHFCTNYEISTCQHRNTPFFNSEKQKLSLIII